MMATITFRITDELRDALQREADIERRTLSDFIRERLEDAVFKFRDDREPAPSAQSSMSLNERHTLALLHRILARVLPEDANDVDGDLEYQLERAEVLERGFTSEYWVEFAGIHPELSPRQCEFVSDVLQLFRIARHSIEALREGGTEVEEQLERGLTYKGFDHNDALEGQMSDYVQFMVKDDKWSEQAEFVLGPSHGNSHMRMIEVYSRMLTQYRQGQQNRPLRSDHPSYLLDLEELTQIADAAIHPSNR